MKSPLSAINETHSKLVPHPDPAGASSPNTEPFLLLGPNSETSTDDGETQSPRPLPTALLPVPPFDAEKLLPRILRRYVLDGAERLQVDASFVAVPLIIALGSVLGNRIGIRPRIRDDWTEFPNVWGAIIGRPSTLKSPAINEGMRPLRKLEAAANAKHKQAMSEWKQAAAASEVYRNAAKANATAAAKKGSPFNAATLVQGDDDEAPPCRRFSTQDATPESLHAILTAPGNATGVAIINDELTGLLARLNDADRGAVLRSFLLSGWSGNVPAVSDRIGRGLNLRVEKCCLSVFGGIQPGKMAALIDGANRESIEDDGWMQRLQLLVWPDPPNDFISLDRAPCADAYAEVLCLFEDVEATQGWELNGADYDVAKKESYLRFTQDASVVFDDWLVAETKAIRAAVANGEYGAAIESHFIKYRKLVSALALIFHVADEIEKPAVTLECLERALAWLPYLKAHAMRVYGSGGNNVANASTRIIQRIKKGELPRTFTARDVKRPSWSGLSDGKTVDSALEMLVSYGWLAARERETDGRPTTDFTAHPEIFAETL